MPWYVVLGALALFALLLYGFLKLRPRFVAVALERRAETRVVTVSVGQGPGSWGVLFVVTAATRPGRRADVVTALAQEVDATDVVRGLLTRLLGAVLAERQGTDAPFAGTLDDRLRDSAAQAFERAGLRLERLELRYAVQLDGRLARLAGYVVCDAQRGTYQGECPALELYLDGISGLGEWSADSYETGLNRHLCSVELVRSPGATFKVMRTPSRLVAYRTLAALLGD